MNSKEFYDEVKGSDICPQDFDLVIEKFREYQRLVIATLNEFHRVCESAGVEYQLAFGSLLGCIRDNGQIPWDYDIDVIVPFDKRDRLIGVLKEQLSPDFYFYTYESDTKCQHVIFRLAPVGYNTAVLHVDVFFMTGLPDGAEPAEAHKQKLREYTLQLKAKRYRFITGNSDSRRERLRMLVYKLRGFGKREKAIYNKYMKTAAQFPMVDSKKCCLADSYSFYYDLDTELFGETVLQETEIGTLRIPARYDEILKRMYGDYRAVPALKDRLNEMYKRFEHLEKYAAVR